MERNSDPTYTELKRLTLGRTDLKASWDAGSQIQPLPPGPGSSQLEAASTGGSPCFRRPAVISSARISSVDGTSPDTAKSTSSKASRIASAISRFPCRPSAATVPPSARRREPWGIAESWWPSSETTPRVGARADGTAALPLTRDVATPGTAGDHGHMKRYALVGTGSRGLGMFALPMTGSSRT